MIEVVEDDASFLSLVEAAEAEALGADKAKRRKVSTDGPTPRSPSPPPLPTMVEEGSYTAALRGSRSSLWQQQQQEPKVQQKKKDGGGLRLGGNTPAFSSSSNGNACFNCGMAGHWARDCTAGRGGEGEGAQARRVALIGGDDGEVPEKACPCGVGSCLVLTSNTVKNPGRKFYRCPVKEVMLEYLIALVEKMLVVLPQREWLLISWFFAFNFHPAAVLSFFLSFLCVGVSSMPCVLC